MKEVLKVGDTTYKLHLIPSGFLLDNTAYEVKQSLLEKIPGLAKY